MENNSDSRDDNPVLPDQFAEGCDTVPEVYFQADHCECLFSCIAPGLRECRREKMIDKNSGKGNDQSWRLSAWSVS